MTESGDERDSKKKGDQKYADVKNNILDSNGIFRGMSYSELLRGWVNWLHSDSPYYGGYRGEICYLHGNVSYYYDKDTGFRKQADEFQNRARNKNDKTFRGDVIWSDTSIFVPVISAFYSIGERYGYDGRVLETIADCQFVCRRDIQEGGKTWCKLWIKGGGNEGIDLNDKVGTFEATSFNMIVTENSPLRKHFEMPIDQGAYDTFVVARAILIPSLPDGEYRLQHGGFGRGAYKSDSVHDFIVNRVEDWTHPNKLYGSIDEVDLIPPHNELAAL